jgi:hypothetical protein
VKNDRATIETASAAMNAALTTPIIGMFSGTAIVDGPDGPCDLNAIHTGISLLQQIADRTASFSGRRSGETPFRVVLEGRRMGRMRLRSVVQEEDRLKLYGIGLILPDDMVVCAEPMTSGSGRHFGVRFHTTGGTLEVSTAPGMRPGRR